MSNSKREIDLKIGELVISRAYLEEQTSNHAWARKMASLLARERLFQNNLEDFCARIFKNKLVPGGLAVKHTSSVTNRELNLILSDLHFQSLLDPKEVPHKYASEEESRRLAAVALQTADYKPQYRDNTILNIHLIGDIICGKIHDVQAGAPLAEQCAASVYLLSQMVTYLSAKFKKVVVRCAVGNHGRNMQRHSERATDQKWDSFESIIYYAIKIACKSLPNVEVIIPYSPYYTWDSFGTKGFATHGDTCLMIGSPQKTIDLAKANAQTSEINNKLGKHGLFMVGHYHQGTVAHLSNDITLMVNGCLIPTDGYGLSIGKFNVATGMQLFESVKGHIFGDYRFIKVNEDTDRDTSLDRIIKPYRGLDE